MATIFISYRREDNPDAAGRIYDRLKGHFGEESVFFDIDTIPFGTDFRKHVDVVVSKCDILLVIIGDRWLSDDDQGKSRLENPADFVRIEVEAALKRDIPVVPVPVGNATTPSPSQLPGPIKDLSYRNAAEVRSGTMFKGHIERLINGIDRILAEIKKKEDERNKQQEQSRLQSEEAEAKRQAEVEAEAKRQAEKEAQTKRQAEVEAEAKRQAEKEAQTKRQAEKAAEAKRQAEVEAESKRQAEKGAQTKRQAEKEAEPEAEEPELVAGRVFRGGDDVPEMVMIPAGSFQMGSLKKYERPQHRVSVPSFAIGRYAVTFDEYDAFARSAGNDLPDDAGWGRGRRPVIKVSWEDAQAYSEWLSELTGKQYRLPSEAEWEYAARCGTITKYWWGDDFKKDDNFWANSRLSSWRAGANKTIAIAKFPANLFGLYDTAGNVSEWVEDCWHNGYVNAPDDGSAWLEAEGGDCVRRVIRGGSWYDKPQFLRSAYRYGYDRANLNYTIGFRIAQDLSD